MRRPRRPRRPASGPRVPPRPSDHCATPRDRGCRRTPPGGGRPRRDRLRQDDPAPEDLPRRGAGGGGLDRPHPAAADRDAERGRPHRARAGRAGGGGGRVQGPLPRRGRPRYVRQGDDGRDPRGRDREGPPPRGLRHPHPRRGARAFPQHRPAARPREGGARASSRPPGDRQLRDARHAAHLGLLRGRSGHRRIGKNVPGRGSPRGGGLRSRGSGRDGAGGGPVGREGRAGRHPRLPARRARHPGGGPGPSRGPCVRGAAPLRAPQPRPAGADLPPRRAAAGGAGDERRGDLPHRAPHPVRGRHRARPHQPVQLSHQGPAPPRRAGLARLRRAAPRAVRAARARARACGSIRGRTSRAGRDSPRPRSGARTSRP